MKHISSVLIVSAMLLSSCTTKTVTESKIQDNTKYVDTFIGTGGNGHVFPGAVSPYGMVQLSPDTRITGWGSPAGYHDTDSSIIGFSHTHLSGTGLSDLGDFLFMPFSGEAKIISVVLKIQMKDTVHGFRTIVKKQSRDIIPFC
jgi:putative alpha-1,2-mannosidase